MRGWGLGQHTDLAHYLVVLQVSPGDVHTVVVPVRPWHLLVDICVDACHLASCSPPRQGAGRFGRRFVLWARIVAKG